MRHIVPLVLLLIGCCPATPVIVDAAVGDAAVGDAAVGDAAPDAEPVDAFVPLPPYDQVPDCDDPAFWSLPLTTADRFGITPDCRVSYAHPLARLRFHLWAHPPERQSEIERICVRVAESHDAGWEVDTLFEVTEDFEAYLAGADSRLRLETRVVLRDGHLAGSHVLVEANPGRIGEAYPDLTGIAARGRAFTTGDAFIGFGHRIDSPGATAPVELGDTAMAWLEVRSTEASLRVGYSVDRPPSDHAFETFSIPLAGDASDGVSLYRRPRSSSLHAQVGDMVHSFNFRTYFDSRYPPVVELAKSLSLGVIPDEIVHCDAGVMVRAGSRLQFYQGGDDEGTPLWQTIPSELDGDVQGLLNLPVMEGGHPQLKLHCGVWKDGSLHRMTWDYPTEILHTEQVRDVPSTVGRPLVMLEDGRIIGTHGAAGLPGPHGPRFVTSEHMYGGTIERVEIEHARLYSTWNDGVLDGVGILIANTPEGDRPIYFGHVPVHSCGF